jgi:hypothetical protein
MKDKQLWAERAKYFLLGIGVITGIIFLIGADTLSPPPPNYGRFQISSWATSFGNNSGGVGAFVVDTVTGETKTVYSRIYGAPEEGKIVKNDLKKPFIAID